MQTLVCVPILVDDVASALRDAHEAHALGADLVEFRIDGFFQGFDAQASENQPETDEPETDDGGRASVLELVAKSPLPCIVTCRAAFEGGHYDGDDADRISLYEALGTAEHPPRYLDLELAAYQRSANLRQKTHLAVDHPGQSRDLSTSLILSAHDFEGRPAHLYNLLGDLAAGDAHKVSKFAYKARSLRDNLELFDILAERDRPTIGLCMGRFGLMSRVLAPKFGGYLTFASLRDENATAPGQPTIRELLGTYRFGSITPKTKVLGVIGWPAEHSIGPKVHNPVFTQIGYDGVYMPLPIPPEWEHFKATVLALLDHKPLHFAGASVTIPHKAHVLKLAQEDETRSWEIDRTALLAGAANTLVVNEDGSCRVLNTDITGAIEPLKAKLGELAGKRIGVIGAGGAASAVATGCAGEGAHVVIYNRTASKAEALAQNLFSQLRKKELSATPDAPTPGNVVGLGLDAISKTCCDALVHCTPTGMSGSEHEGDSLLSKQDFSGLSCKPLVFDTVYTPRLTPLLQAAHEAGLQTIDGIQMFTAQARGQLQAWTGTTVSPDVLQKTVQAALD